MFNLTVDEAHTYYVGADGWLVHNTGPCGPILVDNDVLVLASQGNANALALLQNNVVKITPNQLHEFLNVSTNAQRGARKQMLDSLGIEVLDPKTIQTAMSNPAFRQAFDAVVKTHGRGDAALAAFSKSLGIQAYTAEGRLFNYLTNTYKQLQIPITRLIR